MADNASYKQFSVSSFVIPRKIFCTNTDCTKASFWDLELKLYALSVRFRKDIEDEYRLNLCVRK